MLVLSRRRGEQIRLPDLDVTITLVKIKGKSAALGVSAPQDVRVLRGELLRFDDFRDEEARSDEAHLVAAASA